MKKKFLTLLLTLGAALCLFTGCLSTGSSESSASSETSETVVPGEPSSVTSEEVSETTSDEETSEPMSEEVPEEVSETVSETSEEASEATSEEETSEPTSEEEAPQEIDYAAQVKLDMNSETLKQEVTVHAYIDGDTTHFNVPTNISDNGVLKARYLAVNTPESTGKIEEWGKKASNYTKEHLKAATSIILETDGTKWEKDSTGERYMVWVWYKTADMTEYRNLNLELLQEGLAVGSKAGSTRYGSICTQAIAQANTLEKHVHSQEPDPDYFYGAAYEIDLKELRLNIEEYAKESARVAFEGTVTQYSNNGVYVEDFDEETGLYFGVYVYYGFFLSADGEEVLVEGNRMRIVGNVQYYETGDTYQVADLTYDAWEPDNPDNIQLLDTEKWPIPNTPITIDVFNGPYTVEIETEDEETSLVTYDYAELILNTTVSMTNLKVVDSYTTDNGGNNDGAMTLTCRANGQTVQVRTMKIYNADGSLVTADQLDGKTIDVVGIVDYYNGDYQIKVFSMKDITIHE